LYWPRNNEIMIFFIDRMIEWSSGYVQMSMLLFSFKSALYGKISHVILRKMMICLNVCLFLITDSPSFAISRIPGFGFPLHEGLEVSLKCDVDSNPPAFPKWMKGTINYLQKSKKNLKKSCIFADFKKYVHVQSWYAAHTLCIERTGTSLDFLSLCGFEWANWTKNTKGDDQRHCPVGAEIGKIASSCSIRRMPLLEFHFGRLTGQI